MARTSRVVLNRQAVAKIRLGLADGLFDIAQEIVATAQPPDAPPYGRGLLEGGGALAWVDGKKVAGTTIGGKQIKKPRAVKLPKPSIVAIAGFGFPGRFAEFGTVRHRAQPFLAPARDRVLPDSANTLRAAMKRALRQIR